MKLLFFASIVFMLSSCSPPTKQEALDYYITIRYEKSIDIMSRLDEQYYLVNEFFSDPRKLTTGPSDQEFDSMMIEQEKLVPDIRKCVESLEKIDLLGDNAEFLENMKIFLYYRLLFEDEVMMRLVKSLEDGMTSEESAFLQTRFTQLFDLRKQQDKFLKSEDQFLDEFMITDDDVDK